MLRAVRSWVLFPMRSFDFSFDQMLLTAISLGSTEPLTEMSIRNLPGGKVQSTRKADNLTAIFDPMVYNMWEPRHLTNLWASTPCYRDSYKVYTFTSL
jgi:hypothetical protein